MENKNSVNNKVSGMNKETVSNSFAMISAVCLMSLVPLYFEQKYFNILQAKMHIFLVVSILSIIVGAGCIVVTKSVGKLVGKPWMYEVGILIMGCVSVISCVLADNKSAAFWGHIGWGIGTASILCAVLLYLFMARFLVPSANMWLIPMAVNAFIFICGILHSSGIDVFKMHENIALDPHYYISTIGNINWYSGYLCLIIPFFAVFFINSETKDTSILLGAFLALGFMNVLLCRSDSIFAGAGMSLLILMPYVMKDWRRIIRLSYLIAIMGVCCLAFALLPPFSEIRVGLDGMTSILSDVRPGIALVVLGIIVFVFGKYAWNRIAEKGQKAIAIVLEIVLIMAAVGAAVSTVMSFDNEWGTGRGQLWIGSVEIFKNWGIKDKLVGIGPEMLYEGYSNYNEMTGKVYLASHSEPIQTLLTLGVIGIVGWLLVWGGLFTSFFKKKVWKHDGVIYFIPIWCYFWQSLFNSMMATNLAVLCVFFACYTRELSSDKS